MKEDIETYRISPMVKEIQAGVRKKQLTFTITRSEYLIVKIIISLKAFVDPFTGEPVKQGK